MTDALPKERIEHPLDTETRDATAVELQGALIDLVDLSLQAKQAHWTVVGPRFRALHLLLDQLVMRLREWSDEVAERCTALGRAPDGNATTVATSTALPTFPAGFVNDEIVVHTMANRLADVAGRMRRRIAVLRDADPVSEDLVLDITRGIEDHSWMIQAMSGRPNARSKRDTPSDEGKTVN